MDVRHLFARDFYASGKILPKFGKSEDNIADGCTKNQPEKLSTEHEKVLLNGILPYRREDVEQEIETEKLNSE
jgi:hypothetical protein